MKDVKKSTQYGALTGIKNGAKVGTIVSALNIGALVVFIALQNNIQDENDRLPELTAATTIMCYITLTGSAMLAPVAGVVVGATAGSIVGMGKGLYNFFTADEAKNPTVIPDTRPQKQ